MRRRPSTLGSAWGTLLKSVKPKADALDGHPWEGAHPSGECAPKPSRRPQRNARSEELTEVSSFHNGCPNGMGRPILNVPRNGGEVGNDVNKVFDLADDGVEALVTEMGGHGCGWGG